MKLMFASDIHGSLPATERVLERFAASGAQWLVILGDVLNHGNAQCTTARLCARAGCRAVERAGSADYRGTWQLRQRSGSDAPAFSDDRAVAANSDRKPAIIFDTRTSFWSQNMPALNVGDVLVYGHTHLPVAERQGDIYHFNPGSVSIPKGDFAASYGILDDNVLSVMALNDQSIIAQVEINP